MVDHPPRSISSRPRPSFFLSKSTACMGWARGDYTRHDTRTHTHTHTVYTRGWPLCPPWTCARVDPKSFFFCHTHAPRQRHSLSRGPPNSLPHSLSRISAHRPPYNGVTAAGASARVTRQGRIAQGGGARARKEKARPSRGWGRRGAARRAPPSIAHPPAATHHTYIREPGGGRVKRRAGWAHSAGRHLPISHTQPPGSSGIFCYIVTFTPRQRRASCPSSCGRPRRRPRPWCA